MNILKKMSCSVLLALSLVEVAQALPQYGCRGVTESGKKFIIAATIYPVGADNLFIKYGETKGQFFSEHSLVYRPGLAPLYLQKMQTGSIKIEIVDKTHMNFKLDFLMDEDLVQESVKGATCVMSAGEVYPEPILSMTKDDPMFALETLLTGHADEANIVTTIIDILKYMEEETLPRETEVYGKLIAHINKFTELENASSRYFYLQVLDCMLASKIADEDKISLFKPFLENTVENNAQVYLQTAFDTLSYGFFDEKKNAENFLTDLMEKTSKIKNTFADNYGIVDPASVDSDSLKFKCDFVCFALQKSIMTALNSPVVSELSNREKFIRFYFDELITATNRETFIDKLQVNPKVSDLALIKSEIQKYKELHP